jgi:hypothetical protein
MATADDAVMGGLGSSLRTYREYCVSVNWISLERLWVAPEINDYCKRYQLDIADRASAEADRERSQQGAAIAANSSRSRKRSVAQQALADLALEFFEIFFGIDG